MLLPRSLTSCDRWRAHVLAESWGLMHESTGEGASRRLVLWKPSRSRRSLKPSMLQGASSDSDGGDDAPSSSGGGGSSAGPSNAAVGT